MGPRVWESHACMSNVVKPALRSSRTRPVTTAENWFFVQTAQAPLKICENSRFKKPKPSRIILISLRPLWTLKMPQGRCTAQNRAVMRSHFCRLSASNKWPISWEILTVTCWNYIIYTLLFHDLGVGWKNNTWFPIWKIPAGTARIKVRIKVIMSCGQVVQLKPNPQGN